MRLSLDISSKTTGWGVFDSTGRIDSGKFIPISLTDFRQSIYTLCCRFAITEVVIEDIFLGPNKKTFRVLAQHHGIVLQLLETLNLPVLYKMPTMWRKDFNRIYGDTFSGKRVALKKQSIAWVFATYQLKVTDDEADAICLGLTT